MWFCFLISRFFHLIPIYGDLWGWTSTKPSSLFIIWKFVALSLAILNSEANCFMSILTQICKPPLCLTFQLPILRTFVNEASFVQLNFDFTIFQWPLSFEDKIERFVWDKEFMPRLKNKIKKCSFDSMKIPIASHSSHWVVQEAVCSCSRHTSTSCLAMLWLCLWGRSSAMHCCFVL